MAKNADPYGNDDEDLVAKGWWGQVKYARGSKGQSPAREWLENSDLKVQASFDHLFRRMAESGVINNKLQFRVLWDNIWEFKRRGDRILCFQDGNTWYLCHHFSKGSKLENEVRRAERMRFEQMERNQK